MLPPRYSQWIIDLLGGTLPEEQVATCERCVMQTTEVPEGYRFRADAKCCTYVPALPNFLVGASLRELPPGPARASLERIERSFADVLPLEVMPRLGSASAQGCRCQLARSRPAR